MKYPLFLSAVTLLFMFIKFSNSSVIIKAEKISENSEFQYLYNEDSLPENILNITSAPLNPDIAVCISDQKYDYFLYTQNGGKNWESIKSLPDTMKDNNYDIVLSADGSSLIWSDKYITTDFGKNWYYIEGLEDDSKITADKVNPLKFYAVSDSTFCYSYDGGYNFISSKKKVMNKNPVVPENQEGHIWLINQDNNIIYSRDSGRNFSTLKNITADSVYICNIKNSDKYYLYAFNKGKQLIINQKGGGYDN